ncbi:TrkA family potassium uptake protein [Desulfococcus sp.]|uniref:potassium channel family protein n=1 Tax=Desulfococcus sp. TaxID=2025834 RepID=UPI0035932B84
MKTMATQLALLMRLGQRRSNMRLLVRFSIVLILFFGVYSVLFHMLMLYEGRQYSWITGFYWTLTTMSTLGFGDITFTSDMGRFFSVVVLLSGIIFLLIMLPFTFIQFFYAPWLEEQNKARAPRAVPESISGHLIFTHFDAVTVNLVQKLGQYGIDYVILNAELQNALDLHDQGYQVVVGDLDDPETYRRLNIDRAAMVVVMNDDVASTNIIFTIRETNAGVVIVTNADADDSLDILALAGSTHVLQFTKMLGQALARRVHGVSMKANVVGRFDQLLIAEAPAMRTWLQGKTLAESRLREVAGVTVVGIWEQGQFRIPGPQSQIGESTVLVLAGTEAQLDRFDRSIGGSTEEAANNAPVIVLGGGRVGMAVADTLRAREIDFRVVEKKTGIASLDPRFIQGSAADLDVLVKAGFHETPSVIITTHDDNLNIYLTIYCRRLRPDVQIISRASLDRNINTLHRAGANLVMSFSSLVTATILNLLHPQKMLMLSEGLNVFRTALNPKLENRALLNIQIRENTGCSVVAVKRRDELIINPDPAIVLEHGDELVLIGSAGSEKMFVEKYAAPVQASP